MSVLIKGGRIVTAADDYVGDIFIEDERVSLIGESLDMQADKVIDASGKYVIPGAIDPTPTWRCRSAERSPATTSPRGRSLRPAAARRATSTSVCRSRGRASRTRWRRGTRRSNAPSR